MPQGRSPAARTSLSRASQEAIKKKKKDRNRQPGSPPLIQLQLPENAFQGLLPSPEARWVASVLKQDTRGSHLTSFPGKWGTFRSSSSYFLPFGVLETRIKPEPAVMHKLLIIDLLLIQSN